ncbi:MAG: tRNA guanosine(34) transglycosylase Tgt [Phycisphaeraceae bacterium]|nr:MAG: tRNA guanosine(34) transglycosylase Tgt [Phycisphaeraceae bacterium]
MRSAAPCARPPNRDAAHEAAAVSLQFEILHQSPSTQARVGRITTPHGVFDTPAFMPVGTRAAIKGLLPSLVAETGSQTILANTYHLMLRPGADLVERRGGLHTFMNWPGPILTDSGGYQVYSMADLNKMTDEGVRFRSVIDGAMIDLTPERSIEVQHQLGADIIMAFDDCPPSVDPVNFNETRKRLSAQRQSSFAKNYDHDKRLEVANERTIRWLERCDETHRTSGRADRQALFGIVQGGADLARRSWSAERVCSVELPGYAIGGVAVGEGFRDILRVVDHTAPLLPREKPRYLMGVGYERDLVAASRAGCDMFDCVLPTRNGRNANAFTPTGPIRLKNARFAEDDGPIDESCDCPACRGFSRAYLRHLFLAEEMLGPILCSLHNVRHFQRLMLDIRDTIREDNWSAFIRRWPVASEGCLGPDDPGARDADVGHARPA